MVWIITGDKEETTMNISLSAGHIDPKMFIHRLTNIESIDKGVQQLEKLLNLLRSSKDLSHALVVNGQSFSILVNPLLVPAFLEICSYMKATLCCRMTPLQKSRIVQIVKENIVPTPITAAVGDGGNDISMILEAHVGIGIFGKEGLQAARIADYAIGKFRFLRPLILFHGQDFYVRLATFIDLYFFKSVLYVNPLFLYAFFNAFSSLYIYDDVTTICYNLTVATYPMVAYGIFDQQFPRENYFVNPQMYSANRQNRRMRVSVFIRSFFFAFLQSGMIFFLIYLVYSYNIEFVGRKGDPFDHYIFGELVFYCVWGLFSIKIWLVSRNIPSVVVLINLANIIIHIGAQYVVHYLKQDRQNYVIMNTLLEPFSWLLIGIIVLICTTIDVLITVYNNIPSSKIQDSRELL